MKENFDVVIGLEIHAELNTKTKAFCGCANVYGSAPNSNCCPICLAYPDTKGMLNKEAVRKTIVAGLAMDCKINDLAIFERKHYFYPDLPKAFQTSQLERPICIGGGLQLSNGKFARLNRIHLEEDASKLLHNQVQAKTMVDFNRGGVPLIEIVTEPDFSTAAEVVEFLEEVRSRMVFSGVADCRMEQGGMRCDINISLKPKGSKVLGNRAEIKNVNSFKMVARAIEYEINRQSELLSDGKTINVETRKWNEGSLKTIAMRNKEQAHDYRYYPAPDMPAIAISIEDVEAIRKTMPVLAHQLREKFTTELGLPKYDAEVLTKTKEIANYYLACLELLNEPKKISNWIMVDVLKLVNEQETPDFPIKPKELTEIIKMVEAKTITKTVGLQLMEEHIKTGKNPTDIAKTMGAFDTISDDEIISILKQLKNEKPNLAEDYRSSPDRVLKFIIGHVMKCTKGKAKSDIVEQKIAEVFA